MSFEDNELKLYTLSENLEPIRNTVITLESLISKYSGELSLNEVLVLVRAEFDALWFEYKKFKDEVGFEKPSYYNLRYAMHELMQQNKLSLDDMAQKLGLPATDIDLAIRGEGGVDKADDKTAVYIAFCEHFNLDKEQYKHYTTY